MREPDYFEVSVVITHINGDALPEPKKTTAPSLGEANAHAEANNWTGSMADKFGNIFPLRDEKYHEARAQHTKTKN